MMVDTLLEVKGLIKDYPVQGGYIFKRSAGMVSAVDRVAFAVREGETFGLVGESGSGKTTVAKLVLRLEDPTAGNILFRGQDITRLKGGVLKRLRSQIQAVFQDPVGSLNPRMRIRDIIAQPLVAHSWGSSARIKERVTELIDIVSLPRDSIDRYPHEFSGGQRQRIGIARALALSPSFVVLDEPVSALDVSIRAQILNLLKDLQQRFGLTYLFIAHDLAVVEFMSAQVGVMCLGRLVELAPSRELHQRPLHPYTQVLLSSVLPVKPGVEGQEIMLEGDLPSPLNPPSGCRFRTRCWRATGECAGAEPTLREVETGHFVACPKV